MPRDNVANTQKFVPLYAITTKRLVERLTTAKASGSVFSVVLCLKAYAMDKDFCFPSHKTIQDWCGGNISIRSIERAVKWLEDQNFIKRNSRTSKKRYVLYIDRHKSPEAKSKPTELSDQSRQIRRQKKINEKESLKTPNPFEKGKDKQRSSQSKRRRRRSIPRERSPEELASERSKMLINTLDLIAVGMTPSNLPEDAYESLLEAIEPWFDGMNSKKRVFLKLKSKSDLSRVYEAISLLLPEVF